MTLIMIYNYIKNNYKNLLLIKDITRVITLVNVCTLSGDTGEDL